MYYLQKFKSPIGVLCLVATDSHIEAVVFQKNWAHYQARFPGIKVSENKILKLCKVQLQEYFEGKREKFDLPYAVSGTPFQNRTWKALAKVPFGETRSYKEQAVMIKSPAAVRAVGRANGLNPLCIVLPCHRIVGSNGKLTGYAGGLKAKKYLLQMEGISLP